jgi:ribonuclease HII
LDSNDSHGSDIGIDEAGRGSVIGPLVVAGVMIDEELESELKSMGVKDSKMLTPEKREELYPLNKEACKGPHSAEDNRQGDRRDAQGQEPQPDRGGEMAQIIKAMKADRAFVDAPQVFDRQVQGCTDEHGQV